MCHMNPHLPFSKAKGEMLLFSPEEYARVIGITIPYILVEAGMDTDRTLLLLSDKWRPRSKRKNGNKG